jgi:hypothetical protein
MRSPVALWLLERFGMSLAAASVFFFWSSVLSALSFLTHLRQARGGIRVSSLWNLRLGGCRFTPA